MIKQIQEKVEKYIQFTDEELETLGIEKNAKFTVETNGAGIKLTPYKTIEFDLEKLEADFKDPIAYKNFLEHLVTESCNTHRPVEEIIEDILRWGIDNKHLLKKSKKSKNDIKNDYGNNLEPLI